MAGYDITDHWSLCLRVLECGFHRCESACHPAQCEACRLSPAVVRFCPCLKTPLSELEGGERQSCTDAVPTCTQVCDKELLCGPPGESKKGYNYPRLSSQTIFS